MRKMLISDYDNTLYTSDESIKENIKKIEEFRKQGNLFVVATGRTYNDFLRKINLYKIEFDYLILNHGAVVLNNKGEAIKVHNIDISLVKGIIEDIKGYLNIKRIDVSDLYTRGIDLSESEIITKISVVLSDLSEADRINELLNSKYSDIKTYILRNKTDCIEIIPKETSKAEGIKFIAEKEQIEPQNIHVIGDASNDLEMIKEFSGYGMINSEEIVKSYAKKLYPNVYNLINDII